MSFSSELTALLTRIAEASYAESERAKMPHLRNPVVAIAWMPRGTTQAFVYAGYIFLGRTDSSHEKMVKVGFEADRRADIDTMMGLLRQYLPALDTEHLGFHLRLHTPSKTGRPRFRLEIMGRQICGDSVQIPTLVKHLEKSRRYLEGVPNSTARSFEVDGLPVQARDSYDALRIHAALAFPGTLENPPATTPQTRVVEIVNTAPLFQSLFASVA